MCGTRTRTRTRPLPAARGAGHRWGRGGASGHRASGGPLLFPGGAIPAALSTWTPPTSPTNPTWTMTLKPSNSPYPFNSAAPSVAAPNPCCPRPAPPLSGPPPSGAAPSLSLSARFLPQQAGWVCLARSLTKTGGERERQATLPQSGSGWKLLAFPEGGTHA